MSSDSSPVVLGRTGLRTSALGLGSSYGLDADGVEHAFARGVRYFYWGSYRLPSFGRGIARLAKEHREELVVVVQSYTRVAGLMRGSLERALRKLGLDHADVLLLGWWNARPPERILDAARALVEEGRARHLMISSHDRPAFPEHARTPGIGALMVRYNAAHPGAEEDVFPELPDPRPGVVAYTATRWGNLLDAKLTPKGEPTPRASDCYRFALTHPSVDVCLSGPRDRSELDEALTALDRGPMTPEELAWMKRVGAEVKRRTGRRSAVAVVDGLMGARTS